MIIVGLNLWTGAPLLALWVGAQMQRDKFGLSVSTVFVVIAVLTVTLIVLYRALQWLDARYGDVIGRKPGTRQPLPWLKSVSGERFAPPRPREPLTALERILVLVVVAAVACFEVWFFFLAGSPLPNQ